MSSSLKFKKVYIDTKFMTADSRSTSDFNIELPETMYFDNNSSVFYIDDACIPHSWHTVSENLNDKLYLLVGTSSGSLTYPYIITLAYGNYTPQSLATEIQAKINEQTVNLGAGPSVFQVTYNSLTNNIEITIPNSITIAAGLGFYILTPNDLKTKLGGRFTTSYDVSNPHDCNELIGNYLGDNDYHAKGEIWTKGQVNLQPIRNIYMHSSALGNLSNIGPDGSQTVIKKIPVSAEFNNFVFDQTVIANDYNSCSGQTLKKLDFQFKTSRGDVIPFNGLHVSFSLVFSRAQPDA
jgi:hypothetical protein